MSSSPKLKMPKKGKKKFKNVKSRIGQTGAISRGSAERNSPSPSAKTGWTNTYEYKDMAKSAAFRPESAVGRKDNQYRRKQSVHAVLNTPGDGRTSMESHAYYRDRDVGSGWVHNYEYRDRRESENKKVASPIERSNVRVFRHKVDVKEFSHPDKTDKDIGPGWVQPHEYKDYARGAPFRPPQSVGDRVPLPKKRWPEPMHYDDEDVKVDMLVTDDGEILDFRDSPIRRSSIEELVDSDGEEGVQALRKFATVSRASGLSPKRGKKKKGGRRRSGSGAAGTVATAGRAKRRGSLPKWEGPSASELGLTVSTPGRRKPASSVGRARGRRVSAQQYAGTSTEGESEAEVQQREKRVSKQLYTGSESESDASVRSAYGGAPRLRSMPVETDASKMRSLRSQGFSGESTGAGSGSTPSLRTDMVSSSSGLRSGPNTDRSAGQRTDRSQYADHEDVGGEGDDVGWGDEGGAPAAAAAAASVLSPEIGADQRAFEEELAMLNEDEDSGEESDGGERRRRPRKKEKEKVEDKEKEEDKKEDKAEDKKEDKEEDKEEEQAHDAAKEAAEEPEFPALDEVHPQDKEEKKAIDDGFDFDAVDDVHEPTSTTAGDDSDFDFDAVDDGEANKEGAETATATAAADGGDDSDFDFDAVDDGEEKKEGAKEDGADSDFDFDAVDDGDTAAKADESESDFDFDDIDDGEAAAGKADESESDFDFDDIDDGEAAAGKADGADTESDFDFDDIDDGEAAAGKADGADTESDFDFDDIDDGEAGRADEEW